MSDPHWWSFWLKCFPISDLGALGLAHILFVANFATNTVYDISGFTCEVGFAMISAHGVTGDFAALIQVETVSTVALLVFALVGIIT